MNVLLIHQTFASPNEAGGTRHFELARHALSRGLHFTIVTSILSYRTGKRTVEGRGLVIEQNFDGISILRTWAPMISNRNLVWRLISFLSFMITCIFASLRAGEVNLVMGTSPPVFQAGSAWLVAKMLKRPFLLEIRDLWPEFAIDLGIVSNPVLIALARRFEDFLYRHARHILVNSPAYQDYLFGRGVAREKISLVPNGVDSDMFDPNAKGLDIRRSLGLGDKFVVTYTGALGLANDIDTILAAANRLKTEPRIHFLLVGEGNQRPRLMQCAGKMRLPNVTFTGSFPKSQIKNILAASDACVATLKDIPMFRTTYPNKVFDYMAAGRPILLCIDGVIRKVVQDAKAGLFIPPSNDKMLAQTIQYFYQNRTEAQLMGMAGREYVIKHFNRSKQGEDFVELIRNIASKQ